MKCFRFVGRQNEMRCIGGVLSLLLTCVSDSRTALAEETAPPKVTSEQIFVRRIAPLLREKCLSCHGADPTELEGGLDLRTRMGLLQGGSSERAAVVVGKPHRSPLYLSVQRQHDEWSAMPPKESERLTGEQLAWVSDWISGGAAWPDQQRSEEIRREYDASWSAEDGVPVKTSGGLSDAWTNRRYQPEKLWAWRPLQPDRSRLTTTVLIDSHISRALPDGLMMASQADRRTLIRRVSFDLTGLPPTPAEVRAFLDDNRPDTQAFAPVVDRLLESSHYGERMAQHWLDVVRYADSAGFANDYTRPNAWRYRDYVVRSFNEDRPYDEFVRQQIAGDEIDPDHPENVIATGFLRMGPWEQTGMSVFRITRQQWLDDVTDSVGQTFLAQPLQCAKCHDHKFDPIPTRDYYSVMAVFSTTQFADRDTPFLDSESRLGFAENRRWTEAKIAAYADQKKALSSRISARKKKEDGLAKVGDNGLDPGDEASLARMTKNIARHTWELERTQPIAFSVHTGRTVERKNVSRRIPLPANRWAKGILERDTILTGGDAYTRGAPVVPAPLSAAVHLGGMTTPDFPGGRGPRRLALADWIVDRRNPLTARVIANRIWSWLFGRGIAANPNNFGATGSLPTHPQLLDTLATRFQEGGWSVRRLVRAIVMSQAYRRSSRHPRADLLAEKDPRGQFYAVRYPRRLTAEELRDAMLTASGELNRAIGGIPCRPEINQEVARQPRQIMGGTASVYEPDRRPELRNRRSLYAEKLRGLRNPFFETFNQPGPDKSCELRETSTVAPQALTLFNSRITHRRALAFAADLVDGKSEFSSRDRRRIIRAAFLRSLARQPSGSEVDACLDHWQQARQEEAIRQSVAPEYSDQLNRTVMAEKTGEPYDFVEIMPAYKDYIPDLHPAQADAETRALSHVCLVLFNLNEFAYVE